LKKGGKNTGQKERKGENKEIKKGYKERGTWQWTLTKKKKGIV